MNGGTASPEPIPEQRHESRPRTIFATAMAKKRITRKDLLKLELTAVRDEKKAQGAFDGRFREKVVKSRKRYTRKPKHPKKEV